MKHAKLSASGSAKWLRCPGSLKAEEGYPNTSSPFALEGSCAHEVASESLITKSHPTFYIGQLFHKTVVTHEMADFVLEYTEYVDALITEDSSVFIETKVDFSNYVPHGFGTADAIVVTDRHAHVIDLKYGKGVPVYADNNSQGMLYAIGVLNDLGHIHDIEEVTVHIVQPRIRNFSEWTISVKDLITWATRTLAPAAALCLTDDAPRHASTVACRWCKAKGNCAELYALTNKTITGMFDSLDQDMSDEQTKMILDNRLLIEAFMKAVETNAKNKLSDGQSVAGYKLVAGRSTRRWSEDAYKDLEVKLGYQAYSRKLIGLGEATKLISKEFVAEHTVKPDAKPVLVQESDKRESISNIGFENLDT